MEFTANFCIDRRWRPERILRRLHRAFGPLVTGDVIKVRARRAGAYSTLYRINGEYLEELSGRKIPLPPLRKKLPPLRKKPATQRKARAGTKSPRTSGFFVSERTELGNFLFGP
jgi:hypothetical protein